MLTSRVEYYLREKKHFKTFFSSYDGKGLNNVRRESFCTIKYYSVSLEINTTLHLLGGETSKREGDLSGERSFKGL